MAENHTHQIHGRGVARRPHAPPTKESFDSLLPPSTCQTTATRPIWEKIQPHQPHGGAYKHASPVEWGIGSVDGTVGIVISRFKSWWWCLLQVVAPRWLTSRFSSFGKFWAYFGGCKDGGHKGRVLAVVFEVRERAIWRRNDRGEMRERAKWCREKRKSLEREGRAELSREKRERL